MKLKSKSIILPNSQIAFGHSVELELVRRGRPLVEAFPCTGLGHILIGAKVNERAWEGSEIAIEIECRGACTVVMMCSPRQDEIVSYGVPQEKHSLMRPYFMRRLA